MIRHRLLRRTRDAQTGSALIEVMVSLLVLAIGIGPAFAVFPRSHANAGTAQNLQIASQLGTDSIEQLRATPWATLRAGALRRSTSYPSEPVTDRVTFSGGAPTAYTPSGKPSEPLVATAAATGSQPLDYQAVDVDGRRFGVYRFASWRKESCPLISLSTLLGGLDITSALSTITGLQTKITSVNSAISTVTTNLTGRTSALTGLIGSSPGTGGSLATLTTTANTALTSANSITGSLLTFVTSVLNNTTKSNIGSRVTDIAEIRTTLQAQQATLTTLSTQLTAATAQLSTLGSSLTSLTTQLTSLQSAVTSATASGLMSGNLLDLCQMPDDFELPNLTDLGSLTPKLSEAGTTLDALGIGGSSTLSTLDTSLTSLGTSLTTLTASQDALSPKLSTLTSDIASAQNANVVSSLLCTLLPVLCTNVRNDENSVNASGSLTYSGTISVPAAIAGATSTLSGDSTLFTSVIGTSSTSTASGTGVKGLIDALLATPPVGNTIRVSVAVIPLNAPAGVGPTKPVWVSSVITNPTARLL